MTKTGDTKNKIIELLSARRMTLTDLSRKLNLAPSTVNQHIKELLSANAIKPVENPFVIKWKYYEANPSFKGVEAAQTANGLPLNNPVFKVISALIILGVIGVLLVGTGILPIGNSFAAPAASGTTLFSISDSPTVSTISAVNITVESAEVHSATTGQWYTILNTPKSFNLVELDNISAALATANIPFGKYNEIILEVSNVSAVVDNKSMQVFLPSGDLRLLDNFTISSNGTTPSWVNIDVSLDKSLHFTGAGGLIMMPVINLRASNGANFSVASNGIVTVRSPGLEISRFNESMDLNGTFHATTVSLPEGTHLGVSENGKILILSNPNVTNTLILHTPFMLIVITNITNATAVIANITAQENIHMFPNSTWRGPGAEIGSGPPGSHMICEKQMGFEDCRTPYNIPVNASWAGNGPFGQGNWSGSARATLPPP
jgi:DNA-binding transcriptional ArsR family regulator